MAFRWSSTQPTRWCVAEAAAELQLHSCVVLIFLRPVAGLLAALPRTGSVQLPPWEHKQLVSPSECHSPGSLLQSVHTRCSFWGSALSFQSLEGNHGYDHWQTKCSGNEHSLLERQISSRMNTPQRTADRSDVRQNLKPAYLAEKEFRRHSKNQVKQTKAENSWEKYVQGTYFGGKNLT